jgi:hypothetical protein
MPVKIEFDQFRFSQARYNKPEDATKRDCDAANAFVATANEIVRQIARAGWDVPGVDVTIRYYGRGTNIMKQCSEVSFDVERGDGTTEKVAIGYWNKSGPQVGGYYTLGSASKFKIGDQKELNIYSDGSGDWRKDAAFTEAVARIAPMLATLSALPSKDGHDIDHPEGDLNLRELCTTVPTPAPADFPTLYAWVKREDAYNALGIAHRFRDGDHARDAEYSLSGNGWRFVNGDWGIKWAEIPAGGHEGYDYASPDINVRPTGLCQSSNDGILPVEVNLKHLDDIYVADKAPYENAREENWARAQVEGRKEFTYEEIGNQIRASMVTFVPAAEYKGGYAKPVYMIGRQLQADEARGMAGPVSVAMEDGFVVTRMRDLKTDRDVIIYEGGEELYHKNSAIREARELAGIFRKEPAVEQEILDALEAHRAKLREEYKDDKTMMLMIG